MKSKFTKIIIFSFILVLLFGAVNASAYESYDTYTYSIDGEPLMSPTAYSANMTVNSFDMGIVSPEIGNKQLKEASDVVSDSDGNLYIADKGNDRIVVLNKYYKAVATISSYIDECGREQKLKAPQGLYVTDSKKMADGTSYIYVCDTGNSRLVVFDRSYNYVKTFDCPESPLLNKETFVPSAVAVDIYGRIFIVSKEAFQGIIGLSSQGEFTGFIGAQKVTDSFLQRIWKRFQTDEQRETNIKNVSVAYNNITVDDHGFIYVTTDKLDKGQQFNAIKTKAADFSPVKKLNASGREIMKRNGFFDPGGEVITKPTQGTVSKIIDVALGDEGAWTIIDQDRSRMYTYDQNGSLLFAFGDKGQQLGNGERFVGLTYQVIDGVYYMVLLDSTATGYKIIVYSPTEYCNTIMSALRNQNIHNYSASINYWQDVLTRNNNFDLAYIGIGKALYSQGKYKEAIDMLQRAYETVYASKAFAENRKEFVSRNVIWIVLLIILIIYLICKFLGYAKKKNKAATLKVGRKSYWEELIFSFHLIFHPFDGFWDLKHEKRGSVRAATTILGITILSFFYNSIGKGYLFNPRNTYSNIFVSILSILVPVILWSVSNWCLTTLFDGEGRFKDIYIATCYSLAPLPGFLILSTILTNVLPLTEGKIVNLLVVLGFVWAIILLFFGMMVTHDYSLLKNFLTILFSIVAMCVIMFIALLFSSLVVRMVQFVISLFSEIANRI